MYTEQTNHTTHKRQDITGQTFGTVVKNVNIDKEGQH